MMTYDIKTEIKTYKIDCDIKKNFNLNGDLNVCGFRGHGDVDYDDVLNTPIINKNGTDKNPVNFSELDIGNYKISGIYIYNTKDLDILNTDYLFVSVFKDSETNQKIIKFEEFENNDFYIVTITYDDNNDYILDRLSIIQTEYVDTAKQVELLSF